MNTIVKPDSVFACLEPDEVWDALAFADSEDFGETCNVSENGIARLVALNLVKEDETNKGLYWPTDRLEELVRDVVPGKEAK